MSKNEIAKTLSGCLLSVLFFLGAEVCQAEIPSVEVPFEWKGGHIVVKGSIGGIEDLNLVIDTGASSTTISKRVAKKLGLKGKKKQVLAYAKKVKVEEVRLPSVQIGELHLEDVPAWTKGRIWVSEAREMVRIDALIGLDFLKQTNLTIDCESRLVRFGPIEAGVTFQSFYPGLPFVVVRMSVQGQPIKVMLDSGAEDLILFQRRVGGRFSMNKTREVKGVQHSGGKAELRKVQLSEVTIGPTGLAELEAFLMEGRVPDSGLDGVLGIRSLGLRKFSLDFQTNRISWER
jgi:clan AA aspartic protease (TIGR02281 family)